MRAIVALLHKDLQLELRTKQALPAMVLFALTTLVIFHFGLDRPRISGSLGAGVLWITLLFAALLGANRLFVSEYEHGGITAFLLSPAHRGALLIAKQAGLFIALSALESVTLPAFMLLALGAVPPWQSICLLVVVLGLANAGIAVIITLACALAIQTKVRELIGPLIALPLLVPLTIAASKATAPLLHSGAAPTLATRWIWVLALYAIVFGLVSYAVFDFLVDD
jgi:heme exporter protein B